MHLAIFLLEHGETLSEPFVFSAVFLLEHGETLSEPVVINDSGLIDEANLSDLFIEGVKVPLGDVWLGDLRVLGRQSTLRGHRLGLGLLGGLILAGRAAHAKLVRLLVKHRIFCLVKFYFN